MELVVFNQAERPESIPLIQSSKHRVYLQSTKILHRCASGTPTGKSFTVVAEITKEISQKDPSGSCKQITGCGAFTEVQKPHSTGVASGNPAGKTITVDN